MRRALLLAASLLLGSAAAHSGDVEVTAPTFTRTEEGALLSFTLRYPADDDLLALRAVSAGGVAVVLQRRDEAGYRTVAAVPVEGEVRFGTDTLYRALAPGLEAAPAQRPVTLLFDGGALVSVAPRRPAEVPTWLVALLIASATVSAGGRVIWITLLRRSRRTAP